MVEIQYLLQSLRPKQYIKNLVVFAAPFFSFRLDTILWYKSCGAFICFCLISSAIYLFNDIIDIREDRLHPTKRFRPIAASQVSITVAFKTLILLTIISLFLSKLLGIELFILIFLYALLQVFYCLCLKKIIILDVICISSGFILRAIAGGLVSDSIPSPWFLLTISLLALFIAIEKRKEELLLSKKYGIVFKKVLNFYSLKSLMILENFTSISAFISYSLWAYGPTFNGAPSKWMLLTSPMVLYCIIRYKLISSSKVSKSNYSISNQFIYESPEEIFIKDSHLKYSFLIWLLTSIFVLASTKN
tara:strand:- start:1379 stop:2290 length:912 start_codon:yes stop_codon:yes gene_type:complete